MKIVRDPKALDRALTPARRRGRRIGFVPTMGALHEGHLALVRACRKTCDVTVVSIFVNPIQFETESAFQNYPRSLRRDLRLLGDRHVDVVYCPGARVYPADASLRMTKTRVSRILEGAVRPGHFDGVLTIVAKLFLHVRPARAFFGEKDFQQLWLIRKMVSEFPFGVDIVSVPTVRDPQSGLALSSRNALLSPGSRIKAARLYRAMTEAARLAKIARRVAPVAARVRRAVAAPGIRVRYVAVVRESDFAGMTGRLTPRTPCRLLASIDLEGVHLIDNMPLLI